MVRIEIKTENAAFEGDSFGDEVARILRELAETMSGANLDESAGQIVKIRDVNGNTVGRLEVR